MSKSVNVDIILREIDALANDVAHEIAAARKMAITPELQSLLGRIERALDARHQQVNEASKALATLARENELLDRLANYDALTGLHNRRSFDRALARECNRASRSKSRLALLMLDVDHFRDLNNTRGHVYGDECLRVIGAVVREEAGRSTDMAARIGGEEFAMVLPNTSTPAAAALAERMRAAIQERNLEHGKSNVSDVVTISVGVASLVPQPQMDPKVLAYVADQALYDAKRNGRNQVRSAEEADALTQSRIEERLGVQIDRAW